MWNWSKWLELERDRELMDGKQNIVQQQIGNKLKSLEYIEHTWDLFKQNDRQIRRIQMVED